MDDPLYNIQKQNLHERGTGNIRLSEAIIYTATKYGEKINGHISLNPIEDKPEEETFEKAHRSFLIIKDGIEKFRDLILNDEIPVPDTFSLETVRKSISRLFVNQNKGITQRVMFRIYTKNEDNKTSMQAISETDPDIIDEMRLEFAPFNPKESVSYFVDTDDFEKMNVKERKDAILGHINEVVIPNINRILERLTKSQVNAG